MMDERRSLILTILQLAKERNILISKTKLQKLVFLLQKELGVEYFKFIPYKYGPWSYDLVNEVDELLKEGVIKEYSIDTMKFYEIQIDIEKNERVERIANKYIHLPLEYLLALIYANYPEMTELSEIKEKVKEFQKMYNLK